MSRKTEFLSLMLVWVAVGVLGRLIPHLPNATPFISLALLAGAIFSRRLALFLVFIIAVVSDLLLAYFRGYPLFASWMIFTYSGFFAMVFLGTGLSARPRMTKSLVYALGGSFGFWIWTNFGVWLLSGMYVKSMSGLLTCFSVALPFLRNSLLGTTIWLLVLLGGVSLTRWAFRPELMPASRSDMS